MSMIGSQTHKVSENKKIPQGIKSLSESIRKKNKGLLERGISVSELESAVRITAEGLENTYRESEVDEAVSTIAQVAYEMRQDYPKKGREVRHGLVHAQAYRKLKRLASEIANPDVVREIINRHFDLEEIGFTDFKTALLEAGAFERKPIIEPWRYGEIGKMRVSQWLREEGVPYSCELDIMMKIMRHSLSRRRFTKEVNAWLKRHNKPEINWMELDTEIIPRFGRSF